MSDWKATGGTKDPRVKQTPFHLACQANADITVLKAMLQFDPTLATEAMLQDNLKKSPANLLWAAAEAAAAEAEAANEISLDKIALLLLTQFEGSVVDPLPMHHLLHAACALKCPSQYFDRILEEYSAQASQRDDRGILPLHYAAQNWDTINWNPATLERVVKGYPGAVTYQFLMSAPSRVCSLILEIR
jgi:ankyrin repeat protein